MLIWMSFILFAIGVILVVKGGDIFVDAASSIAKASGIPSFVIGATIVSIATTLPELTVSAVAAFAGKTDVTIGNAVGSVTANTGLILAIAMLFMKIKCRRADLFPQVAILIGSVLLLWISSQSGYLSTWGALLLAGFFVLFLIENGLTARRTESENQMRRRARPKCKDFLFFVLGAGCIVAGSRLLVSSGSTLADAFGVPERVIALTMLAIGTSLPELVTTISAIVKKEAALSVGNLVGANLLDIAMVLPVCTGITGGQLPLSMQTIQMDLPVCLVILFVAFLPLLIRQKSSRLQGGMLLTLYAAYVGFLIK